VGARLHAHGKGTTPAKILVVFMGKSTTVNVQ
jgi:hypothetical protein